MQSEFEMRQVLYRTLIGLMEKDERIVVLDADLAKAVGTAEIHRRFPERAYQAGIAEQNMVSVAAGLASYGYIPLTFTFAPFSSRRVCDQVAISVGFGRNHVKLFGGDPGITAQINGGTHMGNEDIGALRSIPELLIFEPADTYEMEKLLPEIIYHDGPVYTRLLRKRAEKIYQGDEELSLLKAEKIREGQDVTLIAAGIMVSQAVKAAGILAKEGISAEIINVHTIKPIDVHTIRDSLMKTGAAVTCDNHNVIGGLGSAVSEVAGANCPVPIEYIGVQDVRGEAADLGYLLRRFHMTPEDIAEKARKVLARK